MFCSFKPRINRKCCCPVLAIVVHLPLPSGCLCSVKNVTILQDDSSSKPRSLPLDFADSMILEDILLVLPEHYFTHNFDFSFYGEAFCSRV